MASASQPHPAFPSRPYSSTIHGKLPDRNGPPGFGVSSATRENARLERERQERERAQREAAVGSSNPLNALTDEQREEINEAFGLFDLDKDQRIDYHEFKVSLKALGFELPKSEILSLLTTHGIPPPSQANSLQHQHAQTPPSRLLLTLPAFQSIAATLISQRDPRDEILRAFALFDTDNKGVISLEDLRRVARELGEGLEEEELVAMIEEFDLEGKGGVGKEEFVGICMG
ncbi:EF-hand-1 [Coleophoma cylindrospora]|uniref:EF-hand-1 n=1 Tax=Coleophoma cylindrospora TaxID=1849047 RepID=A0A3D8SRA2_9HELO|nr:EF-hand-1 [Coleophoma cylindrospora]